MQFHLMVVRAFGMYAKGDIIADPDVAAAVLGSENANDVVRIAVQGG